jgi:hypothetical protein
MAGLSLEPRQGLPKDDRTQDKGIVSAQIPEEFQHQRIVSLWRSQARWSTEGMTSTSTGSRLNPDTLGCNRGFPWELHLKSAESQAVPASTRRESGCRSRHRRYRRQGLSAAGSASASTESRPVCSPCEAERVITCVLDGEAYGWLMPSTDE